MAALVLGLFALAIAFLQPGTGHSTGFIASTVGLTAIATAAHALHTGRYGPVRMRAMARVGMACGIVGSAAMLYSMLVVGLTSTGVSLPADPLTLARLAPNTAAAFDGTGFSLGSTSPVAAGTNRYASPTSAASAPASASPTAPPAISSAGSPAAGPAPSAAAAAPDAAAPAPVAAAPVLPQFSTPADATAEIDQLEPLAGGLEYALRLAHPAGAAWPGSLETLQTAAAEKILLPTGGVLQSVPLGTRVFYSVSSDGTQFGFQLVGARFGDVVSYDSASGTVSASQP